MKPLFHVLVIASLALGVTQSFAQDKPAPQPLHQETSFDSIEDFASAIKAFEPAKSTDYLAWKFAALELGQLGDPKRGTAIRAPNIESCRILWKNDKSAFVFVTANPPIEATHSAVGVLFLLSREDNHWHITDLKSFTAYGKNSSVQATLTSDEVDGGIVTIAESEYGQHQGSTIAASYRISGFSIERVELK